MRKFKNYRAIISQFIAVVMNKTDKIREGQIQIGDKHNYRPLSQPMVKETHIKVLRLITDLHRKNHIDDMTRKRLSQTPNLKHLIHNSIKAEPFLNLQFGNATLTISFPCGT